MAIVVEEGEKRPSILGFAGWFVFLLIAAAAVYYIFFAQPQLVAIPATGNLGTIAPLTQLQLDPTSVIQAPAFEALTSTIALPTPQGPAGVGRPNPFVSP
jgi:hypothetical protein